MEGGDGMVAMVQGCGPAGLSVTLFDGGRKYTLMPNQNVNQFNASSQQSCSQSVSTNQPIRNPIVIQQPMANAPIINQSMITPTNNPQTCNPPMIQQPIHQLAKPQPITYNVRCPQQAVLAHNMERHNSHHSTMTNTDHDKRHISAQVTDGRYTTVYKMLHCNENPTSPPVQVTEFPPQRPTLVPGHGNFQVGGVGSCQTQYAASPIHNTYRGGMVWTDRGAVYSPRSSRQLDPFASSLRKYPSLSPDRSAEVLDRLVNYSKNGKQKMASSPYHNQQNQGTEAVPKTLRDQVRYEECRRLENELSAIKEVGRPENEYMKSRSYGRGSDVRFFKETNKFGTDMPSNKESIEKKNTDIFNNSNSMHKEHSVSLLEHASKKDIPRRLPMSNDNLAVPPSPTASQLSDAVPAEDINSYSTAVENLTNSISIQTLYTPYTALRQKKSVGTTLSSIEFSKCSCQIDLRKTKSVDDVNERDVERKLYRWFSTIDDELDRKLIKAKTVLKLKKNISEWGECLKKGIQHVICYKDDSWYSDSDGCLIPEMHKTEAGEESDIEEVVGYLLDKINNSKEVQAQNLQRETINKLGLKLKEIVQKCKRKKQQTIKDDLLNALYELPLDVSQNTKKVYLEGLASSLTEKMRNIAKQDNVAVVSDRRDIQPTKSDIVHTKDHYIKDTPNPRSETFVVLPTQVLQATNCHQSVEKKPSQYAIINTTSDDIKVNLVIYIRQLSAKVYEWLECIKNEIPHIEEAKLADAVKNLAEDIVDRLKYRELSAIQSIRTSNENDLENLKYQIFKWINKYVGEDNLTTLRRAPDLMKKIRTVPIPNVLKSSKMIQIDEDSDSSNCMKGEKFAKKDLLEKVSEVLPVFKSQTDKVNAATFTGKSGIVRGKNNLKKCCTFVREPSQCLANNARCVKIANVSTEQPSGRRCCSAIPPVSAPEIRINRINDEYFEYLEGWLRSIPIPYSSDSDRELANRARMGISNAFLQSLYSLSLDPAKLNNRFYYEDILEEVLEDLLNELPQIPELVKMKPLLKAKLLEKTMATYELMYKIRDSVSYQQQFVHTVLAMIPERRRSHERISDEMEICSFVDEFILSVRYQNDDPERSKWHRERAYKKIEAFVEELHRYGKIGDDKAGWTFEIMNALDNVPAPDDEILREEVDRIKLEEDIEDWYLSLPVIDNEEVYERIRRKNLKATLVKKIFDMDREINLGDCAGQIELKYEISRFIEKLPLREDGNMNKNIMINTLLTKLKTRTRQREYDINSRKAVSFDEVFPPPACCRQNQNYYTSTINHAYDQTLGPANATYVDDTIEYSRFQENVPVSSSYNEQNRVDDNQFYSINESRMPPEMKRTIIDYSNDPPEDYKYYSYQDTGTPSKQMQQSNISDSRQISNQSYQVPNQCRISISKPTENWGGLHTSQAAGPSGLNRMNQHNYSTFDSTRQSLPQSPKSHYYRQPTNIKQSSPKASEYGPDTYNKPPSSSCCGKPNCFKSMGSNVLQGISETQLDVASATHDKLSPTAKTQLHYSKSGRASQLSALTGSAGSISGIVTPVEEERVAQRYWKPSPKFNPSSQIQTKPQKFQVPTQMPSPTYNQSQYRPSPRSIQMVSQNPPTCQMPSRVSSQINQSMNAQFHPSTCHMITQSTQPGSNMALNTSGRPMSPCFPWCTTCTNRPHSKKCKEDKSCLMPGCDNPKCKVPKSKRRKIQQMQLQLRKMYESGGILDGPVLDPNFQCSPNATSNQNYRCRCMEFYIKKCKKARRASYPYSNGSEVLDVPPCLAFRSPHPCYI